MNEKKQISLVNPVLFLFGIFLITFSYNKLKQNDTGLIGSGKSIGTITSFSNEIRLKQDNQFEWLTIKNSNKGLGLNDRLFTNQNSTANIRLNSGSEIKVAPETLLRIQDDQTINVEQGNLEFTLNSGAKPFEILIGQKKYQIKASKKSTVSISNTDKTTISVSSGDIEITQENQKINISENQMVEISKDKNLARTQLISPVNQNFLIAKDSKLIIFKFEPEDASLKVSLSKDLNFLNKILVTDRSIELPPGEYYWKIAELEPEFFSITQELKTPTILSPDKDQEYLLYDKNIDIKLKLNSQTQNTFHFELYNNELELIKEYQSQNQEVIIKSLIPSDYFLRVREIGDFKQSRWSEYHRFSIKRYEYNENESVVIELKKPNQKVRFEWGGQNQKSSLFEISEDPTFNDIKVSKNINNQNFTYINFPTVGKYFWRARKVNKDGTTTLQKPVQVIIKPSPPPAKPQSLPNLKFKVRPKVKKTSLLKKIYSLFFPVAYAQSIDPKIEYEEIQVNFPKHENVKNYFIEIYTDESLSNPIMQITTTEPNFKWSPPAPGVYFWRLQYIDFWDQRSEFSEVSEVRIIGEQLIAKQAVRKVMPEPPKKLPPKTLKKEKVQEKPKSILKVAKSKKRRKIQYLYLRVGPSLMDINQSNQNNFNISGNIYNSFELGYEATLSNSTFPRMKMEYHSQVGKVFEDKEFHFRRLEFFIKQSYLKYFWITADIKQISEYELELGELKNRKARFLPNLGLEYQRAIFRGRKTRFSFSIGLKPLIGMDTNIDLTYQYYYNKRLCLELGFQGYSSDQNQDDFSQKTEYYSLLTGLKYRY